MSGTGGRIRVAFFTEVGIIGGAERFLRQLVQGLDRDRYEVELLCAKNDGLVRFLGEPAGVPLFRARPLHLQTLVASRVWAGARELKRSSVLYRWRAVPRGLLTQAQNLRNWPAILRALRERPIDVLHINNGGYPGGETCRLAAVAGRRAGIPLRLMTYHNLAAPLAFPQSLDRAIDRRVSAALHAVVAASRASARSLPEVRGFPDARLRVIPYGIPEPPPCRPERLTALRAELGLREQEAVIGVVGSFEPRKGQEVLIRALPRIKQGLGAVRVVFAGEGERRAAAQALTRELGVGGEVIFAGQRGDVPDIMRLLDVLVVPSTAYESLPYVLLEAMAAAKPVVGTRVAGIPEGIEEGVTGRVVPPGDPAALAEGLIGILADRPRAREMGERGRRKYQAEFTASRMLADFERLYGGGR